MSKTPFTQYNIRKTVIYILLHLLSVIIYGYIIRYYDEHNAYTWYDNMYNTVLGWNLRGLIILYVFPRLELDKRKNGHL